MDSTAADYIKNLKLVEHPEGGYYRELFRSEEMLAFPPERYEGDRTFYTSIYFLLEGEQISRFHKLKSDELWYYHAGSQALIYIINKEGNLEIKKIGNSAVKGEEFQVLIKKDSWFAAEVGDKCSFILAGCLVAPGFEFQDFELADRESLLNQFPQYKNLILRFSR